jgi:HD-like signal output (HDOD) protein
MTTTRDLCLEAIAKIEHLFPAPRTLGRAMAMLRDPDSNVGDVAALIASDPVLAADVLRCANSAYYGAGVHISAIDQAIQKIGTREAVRVIGRLIAHSLTKRDLGNYGIDAEDFWAESLFNGLFMERLARSTQAVDADEAYTCGLLRFIGRLAVNQAINDAGFGLLWDGSAPLDVWEREQAGVTQAEAGGILMRRWHFSEEMALAIEGQEALASAESPVAMVQAMHFTAWILPAGQEQEFFLPESERPVVVPRQDFFARANGLDTETVAALIAETQQAFAAARDEHYH